MAVYHLQYGDLGIEDFNAGGALIENVDPCSGLPLEVTLLVEAFKAGSEFQIRLAFTGSDGDGVADRVRYDRPLLEIIYTVP